MADVNNVDFARLLNDDEYLRDYLDSLDETKSDQELVNEFKRRNKKYKKERREYMREYTKRPEYKEYVSEYQKRPEVKKKWNKYQRKRYHEKKEEQKEKVEEMVKKIGEMASRIQKQRKVMDDIAREYGFRSRKELKRKLGLIDKIVYINEVLERMNEGEISEEELEKVDKILETEWDENGTERYI